MNNSALQLMMVHSVVKVVVTAGFWPLSPGTKPGSCYLSFFLILILLSKWASSNFMVYNVLNFNQFHATLFQLHGCAYHSVIIINAVRAKACCNIQPSSMINIKVYRPWTVKQLKLNRIVKNLILKDPCMHLNTFSLHLYAARQNPGIIIL